MTTVNTYLTFKGNCEEAFNFYKSAFGGEFEYVGRLFNALSTNGKVTMPMNKTFWDSYFGMFTDQFSIQWMVSFNSNPKDK